jgi:uncharacterized membrane protein YfcA
MPAIAITNPWLLAGTVAVLGFAIGLTKGGLSGLGLLLTPILTLVVNDVALAVVVLLPMLMVGDLFALRAYWREWDPGQVWRTLPAAVLGAVVGTFLLARLPANTVKIALAIFTLLIVVYKLASDRLTQIRYQPHPWHGPAAGAVTGVASGMFNGGGPPFNAYLLLQRVPPRSFVATTAIAFALLNLFKLGVLIWQRVLNADTVRLLGQLWWVVIFIPVGTWAGRLIITHLNQRVFEWVVSALLALSGIWLLVQSL